MTRVTVAALAALLSVAPRLVAATDNPAFSLTLKDHHFAPAELAIPANTRVRLVVRNLDPTPAEFESDDFKAEKVVPAGSEISLNVGPLKPGSYEFHDEYHEDESKSRLIVK
jgi:hypothetical protein